MEHTTAQYTVIETYKGFEIVNTGGNAVCLKWENGTLEACSSIEQAREAAENRIAWKTEEAKTFRPDGKRTTYDAFIQRPRIQRLTARFMDRLMSDERYNETQRKIKIEWREKMLRAWLDEAGNRNDRWLGDELESEDKRNLRGGPVTLITAAEWDAEMARAGFERISLAERGCKMLNNDVPEEQWTKAPLTDPELGEIVPFIQRGKHDTVYGDFYYVSLNGYTRREDYLKQRTEHLKAQAAGLTQKPL